MKLRNYFAHLAVGFGLSLPVGQAVAQQAATDADMPESAGVMTPERDGAPKWKGFAPVPQAAKMSAESRRSEGRQLGNGQTLRSSSLLGTTIRDGTGQPVGKVVDFVTDDQGNILYPLVSYSGSPGFSGRLFAVPSGSLRFGVGVNNNSTARLSFDPQLLRNAPSFASNQFSDLSDPAFQNRLNAYYQSLFPSRNAVRRTGGAMNTAGSPAVNPILPVTGGLPSPQATGFNTANGTVTPSVGGGAAPAPAMIGPSGSPAGTSALGQIFTVPRAPASIIGPSGSPAGSSSRGGNASSVIGPSGAPGGSTLPGGSVVGPSGSPGGASLPAGNPGSFANPQVNGQGNNGANTALFPSGPFGSPGSSQLFPGAQSGVGSAPPGSSGGTPAGPSSSPGTGSGATPNTIMGPSAVPNTNGASATPNTAGTSATPGGASPAGK